MNRQQEETLKYFQEFMEQERRQTEGAGSSSVTASSSAAFPPSPVKQAITLAMDENHITKHPAHIHCNLEAKDLQVLKELRVDFNNFAQNGMDLRIEMIT